MASRFISAEDGNCISTSDHPNLEIFDYGFLWWPDMTLNYSGIESDGRFATTRLSGHDVIGAHRHRLSSKLPSGRLFHQTSQG